MDRNDEVIKCLKACILSRKGGVPIQELNDDFKEFMGEDIPLKDLGFKNLSELLHSIPEFLVDNKGGIVRTRPNEQTSHLHMLINNQKETKKKARFKKKPAPKQYYQNRPENPTKLCNEKIHAQLYQSKVPFKKKPSPNQCFKNRPENPTKISSEKIHPQLCEKKAPFKKKPAPKQYFQNRLENPTKIYNEKIHAQLHEKKVPFKKKKSPKRYIKNPPKSLLITRHWQLPQERYPATGPPSSYLRDGTSLGGYTVIGDEHMMAVLGCANTALCRPGLTLRDALEVVQTRGVPGNVLIALGTCDVLMDIPNTNIILDMEELINEIANYGVEVVVCTIPPIPSVWNRRIINDVNDLNKWLCYGYHRATKVIDIREKFMNGPCVKYYMFRQQYRAQLMPGCRWAFVGWNKRGRSLVWMELMSRLSRYG